MTAFESGDRFLRPSDMGRTRRNNRRVQTQRILIIAANAVFVLVLITAAAWLFQRMRETPRFVITQVEVRGAVHTEASTVESIRRRYMGANLFELQVADVTRELQSVSWIRTVAVEKKLPSTLAIRITERVPSALIRREGGLFYVDPEGVVLAPLSARVGDPDLPLIGSTNPVAIRRCLHLMEGIRRQSPELFSRISELSLVDGGYLVFDRELAAPVYLGGTDIVEKWTSLYRVAAAERFAAGDIEYADLRFRDRVVVRPRRRAVAPAAGAGEIPSEITN